MDRKPTLEILEDRMLLNGSPPNVMISVTQPQPAQPAQSPLSQSLLFGVGSGVSLLVPPLQSMVNDMKAAQADLSLQFQTMVQTGPIGPGTTTSTMAQAQVAFGKACSDYSRIVVEDHAIHAVVAADTNFVRAVAFAEFQNGSSTDALLLTFGPLLGIDPMAQLTTIQAQADAILSDPAVQFQVTTDLAMVAALSAHVQIVNEVTVNL